MLVLISQSQATTHLCVESSNLNRCIETKAKHLNHSASVWWCKIN